MSDEKPSGTPTLAGLIKDNAGAILRWLIIALMGYAILLGDNRWVRNEVMASQLKPLNEKLDPLPNRVDNLERWQVEQKYAQQQDAVQYAELKERLSSMQTQLAVANTLLAEQSKASDRILRILEDKTRHAERSP